MEAPERIYVLASDLEDLAVLDDGRCEEVLAGNSPLHTMHGSPLCVEYTRSDRRLSAELVERVRAEANDKSMMLNAMERRQRELLRDILREVEGE